MSWEARQVWSKILPGANWLTWHGGNRDGEKAEDYTRFVSNLSGNLLFGNIRFASDSLLEQQCFDCAYERLIHPSNRKGDLRFTTPSGILRWTLPCLAERPDLNPSQTRPDQRDGILCQFPAFLVSCLS
jgi:hypothetical protein